MPYKPFERICYNCTGIKSTFWIPATYTEQFRFPVEREQVVSRSSVGLLNQSQVYSIFWRKLNTIEEKQQVKEVWFLRFCLSWKLKTSIIFCCEKGHVALIKLWKHIAHQLWNSLLVSLQCNNPFVFCLLLSTAENYDSHLSSYSVELRSFQIHTH